MQKKIFLQRNSRAASGGEGPFLRYLVIAVVCLVLLVLIAPYLLKGKSKEIAKRPIPDRGAITKELPKSIDQQAPAKLPETAGAAEPALSAGTPSDGNPPVVATAPEAVAPTEVQPPPEQESNVAAPQRAAAGALYTPEKVPAAAEPAPKDLFPKKSAPSEAPATATAMGTVAPKEARACKPGMKLASVAPGAKAICVKTPAAKPLAGKGQFAVQVGAFFSSKTEAEFLCNDLSKKGYRAVVRPVKNSTRYYVTTGPTAESKAHTLQEQMKIQGLLTTKIIRVDLPAQKPAPKKPATQAAGDQPQG